MSQPSTEAHTTKRADDTSKDQPEGTYEHVQGQAYGEEPNRSYERVQSQGFGRDGGPSAPEPAKEGNTDADANEGPAGKDPASPGDVPAGSQYGGNVPDEKDEK